MTKTEKNKLNMGDELRSSSHFASSRSARVGDELRSSSHFASSRSARVGDESCSSSSSFLLRKNLIIEEMSQAGLCFGHRVSSVHPKMKPYLIGVKNAVHIINLEKTVEKLEEALKFIEELIKENKTILLIGTKIQAKELVKSFALENSLPYISERWLGGTFTNFEIIKKRLLYFKSLENKKNEGELEKYTKKERAKIDRELQRLEIKIGGIKELEKLPDAIFVLDIKKDNLAIKEAKIKGIKIIGITDTNTDPTLIDYPIPANDDAVPSIKYILEKVKKAIKGVKCEIIKKESGILNIES